MKKLLENLVVITFFVLACKGMFPSFLNHSFVQWPAMALFSLLVPIMFAISLHEYFETENKTIKVLAQPLSYLFYYLAILVSSLMVFYGSHSTYYNLEVLNRVYPASLFNDLVDAKKQEERELVAKAIYSEYGAKFPYPADDGKYIVYSPDAEAIELYKEQEQIDKQAKELRGFISLNARHGMQISLYLVASFFILFTFTMYLQQRKLTKRSTGLASGSHG